RTDVRLEKIVHCTTQGAAMHGHLAQRQLSVAGIGYACRWYHMARYGVTRQNAARQNTTCIWLLYAPYNCRSSERSGFGVGQLLKAVGIKPRPLFFLLWLCTVKTT